MESLKAIRTRRSVRKMTGQPLTTEQVDTLLEAVRWSPSWANTQCWEVITVTDQAMKEKLAGLLGKNPAIGATVTAPMIFVFCAKLESAGYYGGQPSTEKGDWYLHDIGMATQNLLLAAHDLNLGAVVVGLFDGRKAADLLGVPQGYAVVSWVPVGHPDHEPKERPRKETSQFTHQERW